MEKNLKNVFFLCGHQDYFKSTSGNKLICRSCGSFFDLDNYDSNFDYTNSYPETRAHHDPEVGNLKVKTLVEWLKNLPSEKSSLVACEVGFGGGHTLKYLQSTFKEVYGIEAAPSNLSNAESLGIPRDQLVDAKRLPSNLKSKVDLWLFLDSFEHIPNPTEFMKWLKSNSSENAYILIVLPLANSLSQKILGKLWPHRIPDHEFHWSETGLIEFYDKFGFKLQKRWSPLKYLSSKTIQKHLIHKIPALRRVIPKSMDVGLIFKFNIGQGAFIFCSSNKYEP